MTIRHDLDTLAQRGLVARTRGGALPAFHPEILARLRSHPAEKESIAQAAASRVRDGDRIMISAGTTTSLIPRFLLGRRDVQLVTNSTLVIPHARINPSVHLTLVGGEFRASAEAMVGPIALREVEQFHVGTAFVGTDGFSARHGVTAHLLDVAEVVRKMAAQATQTVVLADSSKCGQAGFAHILPLRDIDVIITDDAIDPAARAELEETGVKVETVGERKEG